MVLLGCSGVVTPDPESTLVDSTLLPQPIRWAGGVPDQTFTADEAITALTLPAATGGSPPWTYSLTSTVPGLSFDVRTRVLTGTPTRVGTYPMTYTATDRGEGTASLAFNVAVTGGAEPTPTGGKIYWGGIAFIRRANLDGSGRETVIRDVLDGNLLPGVGVEGLAIHAGKMYWTSYIGEGTIERANLDGSGWEVLIGGLDDPGGIAIHNGKMYWSEDGGDLLISRANLDGSGRAVLIRDRFGLTNSIAIQGGKMYWSDWSGETIERANLDGFGREVLIRSGLENPYSLAIDGGKMYWTDAGAWLTDDDGTIEREP